MKTIALIAPLALLLGLVSAGPVHAGELGVDVFPSDQELYEAYLSGEINYETYLNLRELYEAGIDSTELYLLEEIPNLTYFGETSDLKESDLEGEQAEAFVRDLPAESDRWGGEIGWRRYQVLEENGRDKNYYSIKSSFASGWTFQARGRDDYEGRREWSGRSLTLKGRRGPVRKIVVGNYTARLGLGLSVGYRGRLLTKDDLDEAETIAFPVYGGFNGLYGEAHQKRHGVKGLVHFDQNTDYRLSLAALNIIRRYRRFRLEGIVLGALLENRQTDIKYRYYQLGTVLGYRDDDVEVALETVFPKDADAFAAALLESRYRRDKVDIRFSAWHYGDDYVNLAGGGRSGSRYMTVAIDTIAFEFRDRRHDQRGLLLKTRTDIGDGAAGAFSITVYGRSRDHRDAEVMASLEQRLNADSRIRLYYEYDRREDGAEIQEEKSLKTEYRRNLGRWNLRTYLGYRFDSDGDRGLAWFARARYRQGTFSNLEAWLNISRIDLDRGQLDRFYGYLMETVILAKNLELSVKYMYRYNRSYGDREEGQFYLETKASW